MADEEREDQVPEETSQGDAPEAGPEPDVTAEAPEAEPPAPEEAAAETDATPEAEAGEPAADEEPPAPAGPVAGPADAEADAADGPEVPQPDAAVETEGEGPESAEKQAERQKRERQRKKKDGESDKPDVIPGEHLEPDLVLDPEPKEEDEFARYAVDGEPAAEGEGEEGAADESEAPAPVPATPLDLAADARYRATGKRKRAVARVILKPGKGEYTVNGKPLDQYFPRRTLQVQIRGPLDTAGYSDRMDVVARIHGGGVASQAGALRHGVARALVEASPELRIELKRRGFLTRDARVKERKKAGLKKARKRPQFSKR